MWPHFCCVHMSDKLLLFVAALLLNESQAGAQAQGHWMKGPAEDDGGSSTRRQVLEASSSAFVSAYDLAK